MNREHKYRAWDKIHNCYLPIDSQGCFVWGDIQCGIPAERKASSGVSLVFPAQPDKGRDYFGQMCSLFFGDDIILEEFTGKQDSKGQDIYKGDLVRKMVSNWDGKPKYQVIEVKSSCPFCAIPCPYVVINDIPQIEVIGNIHQKEGE